MNSKFTRSLILVTSALFAIVSAGSCAPSRVAPVERYLEFKSENDGCLNDMGPELEAYVAGKSTPAKWQAVWDCAQSNLKMFLDFAEGSVEGGYTIEDVHALISQLMVTNQAISLDLVRAHFRIKTAIFGGSADVLTKAELQNFLVLLDIIRKHSTDLIPHLRNRALEPSPENLERFADAVQIFMQALADSIETSGNPLLSWQELEDFVAQFSALQGWTVPTGIAEKVRFVKGLLIAGSTKGIESRAWSALLKQVGEYARPLIMITHAKLSKMSGPNEKFEFYLKLAQAIQPPLQTTFDVHGGRLNLKWIDSALELFVPESVTTTERGHSIDRATLRAALRLVFDRILKAEDPNYLDMRTLDLVLDWLKRWSRQQKMLETLFNESQIPRTGYTREVTLSLAENLRDRLTSLGDPESLADAEAVSIIMGYVRHFRPTFVGDDQVISFVPQSRYSFNNLVQIIQNHLIAELVLDRYSQTENQKKATIEDATRLIDDFLPIIGELQMMDPAAPDLAAKRFKEATLFTYDSDGDALLSVDELTYYLMGIGSIGIHSRQTLAVMTELCAIPSGETHSGIDHYGWAWMDIDCFRREYFARYKEFWSFAPQLVRYWESAGTSERRELMRLIEIAARRHQESDLPISTFDIEGYSGIIHYVETLFQRFDADYSQVINLTEIMNAFPVFRLELATYGKIPYSDRDKLEAVFTYTVRYGRPPDPKTVSGIASFLTWSIAKGSWAINADRLSLFKVIAVLSAPAYSVKTKRRTRSNQSSNLRRSIQIQWCPITSTSSSELLPSRYPH